MGAATHAVVCYPSPLTLLRRAAAFLLRLFLCFKLGQFFWHLPCSSSPDARRVSHKDLTVSLNARGLGENGASADRKRSAVLEGESGVNIHACQSAFGILASRIHSRGICAIRRHFDRSTRRHSPWLRRWVGRIQLRRKGRTARRSLCPDSAAI